MAVTQKRTVKTNASRFPKPSEMDKRMKKAGATSTTHYINTFGQPVKNPPGKKVNSFGTMVEKKDHPANKKKRIVKKKVQKKK
jgi:hypothetical protein